MPRCLSERCIPPGSYRAPCPTGCLRGTSLLPALINVGRNFMGAVASHRFDRRTDALTINRRVPDYTCFPKGHIASRTKDAARLPIPADDNELKNLSIGPRESRQDVCGRPPILACQVHWAGVLQIVPGVVALTTPGHWVIGVLVNNVWSVAGDSSRPDVNQMLIQYFVDYNLKRGWYIVTSPILTADWEAKSGNRWVVPFGGGLGRIMRLGHQPVNLTA
jgi:hypothetical protein